MTWVGTAIAGSAVVGAVASNAASKRAASAQGKAADQGIAQQQQQLTDIRNLLNPYVSAGTGTFDANRYLRENPDVAQAGVDPLWHWQHQGQYEGRAFPGEQGSLQAQKNLIGLGGADAQQQAIGAIQNSPMFAALAQQGESGILQNASATGGLRGGNTQGALAQFRPNLLNSLINQQYERLGGLTSMGQNAAAGVGNAGMQTGNAITNLLGQQGAAQAGGALAQGQNFANLTGAGGQLAGMYLGGGFGGVKPLTATSALPEGSTYAYQGATLPNSLRGGNM